jgi:Family of unknown function (DUF6000)
LAELERRCVAPFYLKMMRLNALSYDVPVTALQEAARQTTDEKVAQLLTGPWRPRVMGAWLAVGRAERLITAVFGSLETAGGSLTAPPLATVAFYGAGSKAAPSLKAYLLNDIEHGWGSASYVAAILERLDAAPQGVAVSDQDRQAVQEMLAVAHRLAGGDPEGFRPALP